MADVFQVVHDTFEGEETAPLTEADFAEVQEALRRLALVMQVEETFDIAVSNYADFERAVADILIARETRRDFSGVHWHSTRRAMSRSISNLLSSVRTFQHVAESAVSTIYGAAALQDHQRFKSRIYDGSFPYRVMESCALGGPVTAETGADPQGARGRGLAASGLEGRRGPRPRARFGDIRSDPAACRDQEGNPRAGARGGSRTTAAGQGAEPLMRTIA